MNRKEEANKLVELVVVLVISELNAQLIIEVVIVKIIMRGFIDSPPGVSLGVFSPQVRHIATYTEHMPNE